MPAVVVLLSPLRRSARLHPFLDMPILDADPALSQPGQLRTVAAREQALQRGVANVENRRCIPDRPDAIDALACVHDRSRIVKPMSDMRRC